MLAAVLTALLLVTSGGHHPSTETLPDKRLLLATALPAPTPAPEPPAISSSTSTPPEQQPPAPTYDGNLEALICSYPWDCATALRVLCESRGSPTAGTPGHYYGLYQVSWETSSDPVVQVRHAYGMYQSAGGWYPWGYPDGAFGCAWG